MPPLTDSEYGEDEEEFSIFGSMGNEVGKSSLI